MKICGQFCFLFLLGKGLEGGESVFVESDEDFVIVVSDLEMSVVFITNVVHYRPFDEISLGRVFGQLDSYVKRKLIEGLVGILFDVEKPEQSFHEILPFPGKITDIFGPEAKRMSKHFVKK